MKAAPATSNRLAKLIGISATLITAGFLGMCAALVVGGGHESLSYEVTNNTGEDLLTWGMRGDCSGLADDREDYFFEENVPANGQIEYSDYGIFDAPDCIHIATTDRRLVLVSDYERGKAVTVEEPLAPWGDPLPAQLELPKKTFWERSVTEADLAQRIFGVTIILMGLGALGLIAWGAAHAWRLVRRS